jgi:SPP1 gp7 family putative phage head morphogenesis protein
MTLLKTPEIRRLESRFTSLFERTFLKAIKGKTAPSYLKSVKTQFKSKTFQVQVDKIIDDIYLQSIKHTDKQLKKESFASIITNVTTYNQRYLSAAAKPLPITEEAVKQAAGLSKEVTESVVRVLKDDGIYLEHPDKLEKRVRDLWDGEKYRAKRFTRTFVADVAVNTELWRYQDAGLEDMQFYAKIDEKTSDQCRMLHGTIFKTDSKEARMYRPPCHHHCRSSIIPVPITMKVDPQMRFENRDFSRQMDQEFNLLDDRTDKDLIEKTFSDIDTFNEKYRIDQFILDEDLEARLQKLNVQVLSELPKEKVTTKKIPKSTLELSNVESTVQNYEKDLIKLKKEKAMSFDKNGNIIFEKNGEKAQVAFTKDELEKIRGSIFTHNHPGGGSFSDSDLKFACNLNLQEVRAAGKNGVYMARMKDGSQFPSKLSSTIQNKFNASNKKIFDESMIKINKGELTQNKYLKYKWHWVWEDVFKDMPEIEYKIIKLSK